MRRVFNSNQEVVNAWLNGNGEARTSRESLWADGDILYTYRVPLAIRTKSGQILINGDKYSRTSSQHRSIVMSACDGTVISFETVVKVLNRFMFDNKFITSKVLIDAVVIDRTGAIGGELLFEEQDGKYIEVEYGGDGYYRDKRELSREEFERLLRELRREYSEVRTMRQNGNRVAVYCHTAETVLLFYDGIYVLAGFDDQSYFACALPEPANSVEEAFDILKPKLVISAELKGREVLRQGEWFFIKVADDPREIGLRDRDFRVKALPRLRIGNQSQSAHRCRIAFKDGKVYCTGVVRHENKEHTPLKLDGIYIPARNLEVVSASGGRAVD